MIKYYIQRVNVEVLNYLSIVWYGSILDYNI